MHERRHAGFAGTELQAPRCRQRKLRDFTDDAGEALAAQAFFHRRQHVAVLPGLAVDDAIGMKTDARKGGREEIAAAQAPENRARNTRDECRPRTASRVAAYSLAGPPSITSCRCPSARPPPGRRSSSSRDAERQHRALAGAVRFRPLQPAAQFGNSDVAGWPGPSLTSPDKNECSYFVLFLRKVNLMGQSLGNRRSPECSACTGRLMRRLNSPRFHQEGCDRLLSTSV